MMLLAILVLNVAVSLRETEFVRSTPVALPPALSLRTPQPSGSRSAKCRPAKRRVVGRRNTSGISRPDLAERDHYNAAVSLRETGFVRSTPAALPPAVSICTPQPNGLRTAKRRATAILKIPARRRPRAGTFQCIDEHLRV